VTFGVTAVGPAVVELLAQGHHGGGHDRLGLLGDVGSGSVLVGVGHGLIALPARVEDEAFDQAVLEGAGRGVDALVGISETGGGQRRADQRLVLDAADRATSPDIRDGQHLAAAHDLAGDLGDLAGGFVQQAVDGIGGVAFGDIE
jgi:hypothetical protein